MNYPFLSGWNMYAMYAMFFLVNDVWKNHTISQATGFRYHLTWHAFVEIGDSIRTVVHHTGDVKMSPMFSVNKLLQKKLQRSDNLEFKVKFATQISLNYLLCPERFTWTVIYNYLEENCCSTRSSWPNKTEKMVIIQLAAPVGNMKHTDWQPERARGHWITREKRTRPMFTHLDLTFGQITHTYLPKLG